MDSLGLFLGPISVHKWLQWVSSSVALNFAAFAGLLGDGASGSDRDRLLALPPFLLAFPAFAVFPMVNEASKRLLAAERESSCAIALNMVRFMPRSSFYASTRSSRAACSIHYSTACFLAWIGTLGLPLLLEARRDCHIPVHDDDLGL